MRDRKNPRKWNYSWSSVLKTCTTLIAGIFEWIWQFFDEVFLMVPTSMEQLFTERPLHRCFLHNDHFYTLFPVTSARKFLCNVIGFTIFHLSAGVLLEKVFLGILQNSQENTCSKVSFLIKLQAEVTASDHSCLFSWKFLVYFMSIEKWSEKREIPWLSLNIYLFARLLICLTSKISKEIW